MRSVIKMLEKIQLKWLVFATWVAATISYLIQMFISSQTVNMGKTMDKLEELQSQIRLENQLLKVEIASASALQTVEQKAYKLGFEPVKKWEYIK